MSRIHRYSVVVAILISCFASGTVSASQSSVKKYDNPRYLLNGLNYQEKDREIEASLVMISGKNTGNNVTIKADMVTVLPGTELDFDNLHIYCNRLRIESAKIKTSGYLGVETSEFRSTGSLTSGYIVDIKADSFFDLDAHSVLEAAYIGLDFGLQEHSINRIRGKIRGKKSGFPGSEELQNKAAKICGSGKSSCLRMDTGTKSGYFYFGGQIESIASVSLRGYPSEFDVTFEPQSQIVGADHCDLRGKKLQLNGLLQCSHTKLDGIFNLWMSSSSEVRTAKLNMIGGDVELNGKIQAEETELQFTRSLTLNRLNLKGGDARIHGYGGLRAGYLSVLDLNSFLQLRSREKMTLNGQTFSKILDLSCPYDLRASGKQSAETMTMKCEGKVNLSGLLEIGEDGALIVQAGDAHLRDLAIRKNDKSGGKADTFSLTTRENARLEKTKISGFRKGVLESQGSLRTDSETLIAVDELALSSPDMHLEGEFRSKKITIRGNRVSLDGRIIDAETVDFMSDGSINLGTSALLHVLHSLKIKAGQQVTISGEVVSQILDVATPELLLLNTARLSVQEKVAIYTSLWLKLGGTVDFSGAKASLLATGKIDLEGVLRYRNLDIRKAEVKAPEYSKGQRLVLQVKSRARIEQGKELVRNWAMQDPEHGDSDLARAVPEELTDDDLFARLIEKELKKDHFQRLVTHSGKILAFLGQSALDSVRQSLSSSALDMFKEGLYQAGAKSLFPLFSEDRNFFDTAKALANGELISWKKVGQFIMGAGHRGLTDFAGLNSGVSLQETGWLGYGWGILSNGLQKTVMGNLYDPTRLALDFIQLVCTYPFMEEGKFTKQLREIIFGSHYSTKATILYILGYEDTADKIMQQGDKKFKKREGPQRLSANTDQEFDQGNLTIEANDVLVRGAVSANNLMVDSNGYYQTGFVSTKVAKILSDHFKLMQGADLCVEDQAKVVSNIDAIIHGNIYGGKHALHYSGHRLELSPGVKDAFIEIRANKVLSTGTIKVDGGLRIVGEGAESEVVLEQGGKIVAAEFSLDAENARVKTSMEVEDAFFNVYNNISFDSVDQLVVKNYLKVYAPEARLKINSKIIARVIDLASEEFFLMRSGLLSAKEHAFIEAKVHMIIDGVVTGENAELISDEIDFRGAEVKVNESLKLSANNIHAWQKANLSAENIKMDADSGDIEVRDMDMLARKVLSIKGKHFSALTGAALSGEEISIRASGDAYLGEMTRLKASTINIKSHWFTQMIRSEMRGSRINLDSSWFTSMGLIMAENIVASNRLMALGPMGRMLGGTVSISTHGLGLAPLSAIVGGRVNINSTGTVALAFLSGIVGGQVNVRSLSVILAPLSAVMGVKTSIVAPVFFMMPGSLVAGVLGTSVNSLYSSQKYYTSIYSVDGRASLSTFDGRVNGRIGGHAEDPFEPVKENIFEAWQKVKSSLKKLTVSYLSESTTVGLQSSGQDESSTGKERSVALSQVSTGIKAHGTLTLGDNAKVIGKNATISAGSLYGSKNSQIVGRNAYIEVTELADLESKIRGDSLYLRGIGGKARLIIHKEADLRGEKLLRLSEFASAKIYGSDKAVLNGEEIDIEVGSIETQGRWIHAGSKGITRARELDIQGNLGADKTHEEPGSQSLLQVSDDSVSDSVKKSQKPGVTYQFMQDLGISWGDEDDSEKVKESQKPPVEYQFMKDLGISWGEDPQSIQMKVLNIRGSGGRFAYGASADNGVVTTLSAQSELDLLATGDGTGVTGGGSLFLVDANKGTKVHEGAVVSSDESRYFLGSGSLKIDGRVGQKGDETWVTGGTLKQAIEKQKNDISMQEQEKLFSLDSTGPDQGASLELGPSGHLEGRINTRQLQKVHLAGKMTTNGPSYITARQLTTEPGFLLNIDTSGGDNSVVFVGKEETSFKGHGQTTGQGKASVVVSHENPRNPALFGYEHQEDSNTTISVKGPKVSFEQTPGHGVGGGQHFTVKAEDLQTGNTTQHSSETVSNITENNTNLVGIVSTKKYVGKSNGNLTNGSFQIDLRDGGKGAELTGKTVNLDGVQFVRANASKIRVGDEASIHSSLVNGKVFGNEKTKLEVTGTSSANLHQSLVFGNTDVYSVNGKASVENSTISGTTQVFGLKESTIKGSAMGGDIRLGYVLAGGQGQMVATENSSFIGNRGLSKDGQQHISQVARKAVHAKNCFDPKEAILLAESSDNQGDGLRILEMVGELVSEINGSTFNYLDFKGPGFDKSGNMTLSELSEEDRAHNYKIHRLASLVHQGFRANKKALHYTESRGIMALVDGAEEEVSLIRDITPGLDRIQIRGRNFVLPREFSLQVDNFVSFARENHIHGGLLQEIAAVFISEEFAPTGKVVFYEGSRVGTEHAVTEVNADEIVMGGLVKGKHLQNRGTVITYEAGSKRQVESEVNVASKQIVMSGSRVAKSVVDKAPTVVYAKGQSTSIQDGGFMDVEASTIVKEKGTLFELGQNSILTMGAGSHTEKVENKDIAVIDPSERIVLEGEITGSGGSKVVVSGKYLETHGIINVESTVAAVEELVHEGKIFGLTGSIQTGKLKGDGTIAVGGEFNLRVSDSWESRHIKIKGRDLKIYTPSGSGEKFQPRDFDFDYLEAGNSILIAGAIDGKYISQLMSGRLRRDGLGVVKAPRLSLSTTAPLVILDSRIRVEFPHLELSGGNFFMEKGSVLQTKAFTLNAYSLIQASGAVIDSGYDGRHDININAVNVAQVYDYDPEEGIYKTSKLDKDQKPVAYDPAAIRAGGDLKISARKWQETDKEPGSVLSYGGEFESRHGNIMIKSDGSVKIVPITYFTFRENSRTVPGSLGFKKSYYAIQEEGIASKAKLLAAKRVTIIAGEGSDSYLESVVISSSDSRVENLSSREKSLFFNRDKLGSGLSHEGLIAFSVLKIAVSIGASAILGPAGGAAVSGLVNTAMEIGIERTNGGLRNRDEWGIARRNGKNALVAMALSFGLDKLNEAYPAFNEATVGTKEASQNLNAVLADVSSQVAIHTTKMIVAEGLNVLLQTDSNRPDWEGLRKSGVGGVLKAVIKAGLESLTQSSLDDVDLSFSDKLPESLLNIGSDLLAEASQQAIEKGKIDEKLLLQTIENSAINELGSFAGRRAAQVIMGESGLPLKEPEKRQKSSSLETIPEVEEEFLTVGGMGDGILENSGHTPDIQTENPGIKTEKPKKKSPVSRKKSESGPELVTEDSGEKTEQPQKKDPESEKQPLKKETVDLMKEVLPGVMGFPFGNPDTVGSSDDSEKLRPLQIIYPDDENCFLENTWVATDLGPRIIPDVRKGDRVLSCKFEEHPGLDSEPADHRRCTYETVLGTHQHLVDSYWKVHTANGVLQVTGNHPFFVAGLGYLPVEEIRKNLHLRDIPAYLFTRDGRRAEIIHFSRVHEPVFVYNIEVENGQSYFVSQVEFPDDDMKPGQWVLTHNCHLDHPAYVEGVGNALDYITNPASLLQAAVGHFMEDGTAKDVTQTLIQAADGIYTVVGGIATAQMVWKGGKWVALSTARNLPRLADPTARVLSDFSKSPVGKLLVPKVRYYAVEPEMDAIWRLGKVGGTGTGLTTGGAPSSSSIKSNQLNQHLKQAEKYGSDGFKELENGRIRYYEKLHPAEKPGEMAGRRRVREWDPKTDQKKTWHETIDHDGNVRQVRPQDGLEKIHYKFDKDGIFDGKW